MDPTQQQGARSIRGGVDEEGVAAADGRDDRAAGSCPERERQVTGDAHERVRLLQNRWAHGLRHQAGRRGRIERGGRASKRLKNEELPDVCIARDEQDAHRRADQ